MHSFDQDRIRKLVCLKDSNAASHFVKQGPALYKEPWTGRAVSHFILDTELSTSPGRATHKSLISAITSHSAYIDQ